MGWYVTCRICGTEGKYGLECDCYDKQTQTNAQKMVGCTVEESQVVYDCSFTFLIQKFRKEDEVFFMRICLDDGGAEYSCWENILEITEEEFIKMRDHPSNCGDDIHECVGVISM